MWPTWSSPSASCRRGRMCRTWLSSRRHRSFAKARVQGSGFRVQVGTGNRGQSKMAAEGKARYASLFPLSFCPYRVFASHGDSFGRANGARAAARVCRIGAASAADVLLFVSRKGKAGGQARSVGVFVDGQGVPGLWHVGRGSGEIEGG